MRTIYLDCSMGAAGDMLMAALLELLPEKDTFLQKMQSLGLPGLEISAEPSVKCGITGTHMRVLIRGEEEGRPHVHAAEEPFHSHADAPEAAHAHVHVHPHHHTDLNELTHRISHLNVSEAVRSDILAVYQSIADAESRVHGVSVEQIHFHEVGSLDALADVTGVCLLMELLSP